MTKAELLREGAARAERTGDDALAESMWRETLYAVSAALAGEPEPRGMSDNGIDCYLRVTDGLKSARDEGFRAGTIASAKACEAVDRATTADLLLPQVMRLHRAAGAGECARACRALSARETT